MRNYLGGRLSLDAQHKVWRTCSWHTCSPLLLQAISALTQTLVFWAHATRIPPLHPSPHLLHPSCTAGAGRGAGPGGAGY